MLHFKYPISKYLFIVLLALAFFPVSDIHAQDITSGLVAHYTFDETSGTTATDSSGNNNTGTLTNGPVWTTGKIGGAVSFDGADDYVNAGTDPSLVMTTVWSVSFWLYANASPINGTSWTVAGKYSSGDTNLYYEVRFANENGLLIRTQTGGGGSVNFSNTFLSTKTWYHVVVTFNRPNLNFYVNGINDGVKIDNVTDFASGSGTFAIGSLLGVSNNFNGLIDEVRVYNRALSADEIRRLYNMGR